MSFRVADRPARRRSAVAIVAGLALFAAALGFWALRAEIAAGAPPVVASVSTSDAGPGQLTDGFAAASHPDFGSTVNDDKAFKSAGLKRDRPPTFSLSAPRLVWLSPTLAATAVSLRPGEGCSRAAPSTVVAAQNLLTQLCVSRR